MLFKWNIGQHVKPHYTLHVLSLANIFLEIGKFARELGEKSGLVGVPKIRFLLAGYVDIRSVLGASGFFKARVHASGCLATGADNAVGQHAQTGHADRLAKIIIWFVLCLFDFRVAGGRV